MAICLMTLYASYDHLQTSGATSGGEATFIIGFQYTQIRVSDMIQLSFLTFSESILFASVPLSPPGFQYLIDSRIRSRKWIQVDLTSLVTFTVSRFHDQSQSVTVTDSARSHPKAEIPLLKGEEDRSNSNRKNYFPFRTAKLRCRSECDHPMFIQNN